MRKLLFSVTAAGALAAPLVLGGAAQASTAHVNGGPYYVTSPWHETHVWHVEHVEHEAYMASLGY